MHYVSPHSGIAKPRRLRAAIDGERYAVCGERCAVCGVREQRRLRVATSAGGADAVVRWDSCRLDFFATFLVKQKSREKTMNGRLYDPVISRFFSPDQYVQLPEFTQSFNRYSYCLNNPLMYTDPSGQSFSPYYDEKGDFLGLDEKGWKGNIYITTSENFNKHKKADGTVNSKDILPFSKLISDVVGISDFAISKIYTSILGETSYANLSKLHNGAISVYNGSSVNGVAQGYNNPLFTGRATTNNNFGGKINVTVHSNVSTDFTTVESVQNYLGVHEYKGHGILNYDGGAEKGGNHYKAWELQYKDKTFNSLSEYHKGEIINNVFKYMWNENRNLYNSMPSTNPVLYQLYLKYYKP